jgi:hypothetical protein
MIEDKEKYRKECSKRYNKIQGLLEKKDFIDKLVNEFGDASITDISLAIDEDLEKAQKAYDDFTREEYETMKKINEKYDAGTIINFIANGYDQIDMVNAYLRGNI